MNKESLDYQAGYTAGRKDTIEEYRDIVQDQLAPIKEELRCLKDAHKDEMGRLKDYIEALRSQVDHLKDQNRVLSADLMVAREKIEHYKEWERRQQEVDEFNKAGPAKVSVGLISGVGETTVEPMCNCSLTKYQQRHRAGTCTDCAAVNGYGVHSNRSAGIIKKAHEIDS